MCIFLRYYLLYSVIFCTFVLCFTKNNVYMELVNECARLARLAGVAAHEMGQQLVELPEQRQFWWGYVTEDGGILYVEYQRGHGA